MKKIALIIGIGGQDGSYLAEFLLERNYIVHGILRQSSTDNTQRVKHLKDVVFFHTWDILQPMIPLLSVIRPQEVYNLAALSFVKTSFDLTNIVFETNTMGVLNIIQSINIVDPTIKYYQASTSEMFGSSPAPQSENTPFEPNSPYAISKLAAYWLTKNFRKAYGLFLCNGILFNHESPRRSSFFVSKKICEGAANIHKGIIDHIELGNIYAKRDWGHASDYVLGMWKILQHDIADDFVLGTGKSHSVKEFVEEAFSRIFLNITWFGHGLEEVGKDQNGVVRVKINKKYCRLAEVEHLEADYSKASIVLDWKPKITFPDLVSSMMDFELENK